MIRVILLGGVGVSRLLRSDVGRGGSSVAGEVDSELDGLGCPCVHCGRVFSEPVWLTDLSSKPREETYYACPFCFSRLEIDGILGDSERSGGKSRTGAEFSASASKGKGSEKMSGEKKAAIPECPHQFGYLRSRSKGSEIPDECLTCPKILQCMVST